MNHPPSAPPRSRPSPPAADAEPATTGGTPPGTGPQQMLCAYSPRWLSGPTPGYRGLCPTWHGDATTRPRSTITTR